MKKDIPPFEPFPHPVKPGVIKQVRAYQLITPLFGGGVDPGEVDPVTPIRGSEIRGHLRFWWRACRGGQANDKLSEMRKMEGEIWGKAHTQQDEQITYNNIVQIQVEIPEEGKGRLVKPFSNDLIRKRSRPVRKDIPAYAAFPLQTSQQEFEQENPPERSVMEGLTFLLTIAFPEKYKQEVEAAFWAWETFGGIGARTRRGFGAIQLLSINGEKYTDFPAPDERAIDAWLGAKIERLVDNGVYPKNVPHLSRPLQFRIATTAQSPLVVWRQLIEKLSAFRQSPDGRAGRSKWPEAETIRSLTNRRYDRYRPLPHPQTFPRAAFGLPIVFHFKDDKKGDPEEATLQGRAMDRLASPLLLRPLSCRDGKAVGLALLLQGTQPPSDLVLVEKRGKTHSVKATLEPGEAAMIEPLQHQTDVLQAFMNYLGGTTQWKHE